jgi:hypothetical protein
VDYIVNQGFGTYRPRSIWREEASSNDEVPQAGIAPARKKINVMETREWNDLLDLIQRTLSDAFPEAMQALGDAFMEYIRRKRRLDEQCCPA